MTRVGVVGGHCMLIEALRASIRRAESRGSYARGCVMFLALVKRKNKKARRPVMQSGIETREEVLAKRGGPAA